MEKHDERCRLTGFVELDESFFIVELQAEKKNKTLKRGHEYPPKSQDFRHG